MIDQILDNDITYSQILFLLPVLLGGVVLGLIFFAGLCWTVRRGIKSAHPAVWFFSSFLLRTTIALIGIYLLTDGQWPRLLACMLGFIGARIIVITKTRPAADRAEKQEAGHAP
ncbi:ATP synthase subunit I [Psychromonas sp.]|uniref:N-ATPase subunit AtpR n=1 Tax=Psychromonas sp. TaxID=1884585 RepID=UPI0039E38C76